MSEWHGYAKVFSGKEKKKENENCRYLDETQRSFQKIDEFFVDTRGLITVVRE